MERLSSFENHSKQKLEVPLRTMYIKSVGKKSRSATAVSIRGRRGLLLSMHACRYSTSISIRCKRLIILKPPWNNIFFNQRGKYSKIRYQINTHIYSFRKYTFSTKTPLILLIPFFFQKIVIFWQKIAPLIKAKA